MKVLKFLMGLVPVTSQLISMLFLQVPTPFKFFGMTSGAVQKKTMQIISFRGMVQYCGMLVFL